MIEEAEVVMLFEVSVATDERASKVYGYSFTKEEGELLSRGKGWYGSGGYVSRNPVKCYKVAEGQYVRASQIIIPLEDAAEIEEIKKQKRDSALAKLTQEERNLLGV